MVRHVFPGVDPAAETEASFGAIVQAVPRRFKRVFGFGLIDAAAERRERERLRQYTVSIGGGKTAEDDEPCPGLDL